MEPSDLMDVFLLLLVFGLGIAFWWTTSLGADVRVDESEGPYRGLRRRLRHAGLMPDPAAWFFWIIKILLAFLLPMMVRVQEWWPSPLGLLVFGAIGFFLPDLWLRSRVRKRQRKIRKGLSFYLDLVNSLLRSGMTLERSFIVAAKQGFRDPHPLADEVNLLSNELELGRDRVTAFKMLAERTGVMELKVMAAAVQVGLRSGASIEGTLDIQADLVRFRQQQETIARLNRSAAISVAPVFLCGVPLWLILVFFPAAIDLVEALKGLSLF